LNFELSEQFDLGQSCLAMDMAPSAAMRDQFLPFALQDVPRYTSYPTAVQFRNGFPAERADAWLKALPSDASLSIYVHIPFCRQLCWYCGCHTSVPNGYERAAIYARLLTDDIARASELAGGRKGRVKHLHFGGGTPSYLGDADLASIVEVIAAQYGFSPGAEIAIELDPRTIDRQRVAAMKAMGFNRASLGVQDFAIPVQLKINRFQAFGLVAACTDYLREAGFQSVNFDLIYGLPAQTTASVADTARRAAELGPDRLAVFGYAHVPWFKKHQRMIAEADLPGVSERYDQARAISAELQDAGYRAIGLDHFAASNDALARAARSGTLRRNFQGYTTDATDALLAFGASAISQFPNGYVQAARDTLTWSNAIAAGINTGTRGIELTDDDRMRAEIIERLMCDMRVDAMAIAQRWGLSIADAFEKLEPICDAGLATVEGGIVAVPDEHRLFLRNVASAFDAYFAPAPKRHARAV
jgi:oxygen-independent coproporphyrinogen-3 oxidase